MTRWLLILCLALSCAGPVLAGSGQDELLDRLLAIADADQIAAYHELDLSPEQLWQLRQAATGFLPRVREMNGPTGPLLLVPEALSQVDRILTPRQRPLARKLVPRAHQWPRLKALLNDYRD
jgi:hypothetical protein